MDYTQLVTKWAKERNLHTADPIKQLSKLLEESGELANGINKNNKNQIIDSIGDIQVVLIVLSCQLGLDYNECLEVAYNEIKDRKGQMINGIFVKEEDLTEEIEEPTPLRKIRVESGLLAKFVREKVGLKSSTYSRYENGKSPLPHEIAMKIAPILNVEWHELYKNEVSK